MYTFDDQFGSWEIVENYTRDLYFADISWDGTIVTRATDNKIYIVDDLEEGLDHLHHAQAMSVPSWTVKQGLWGAWSSTLYNYNFATNAWNSHSGSYRDPYLCSAGMGRPFGAQWSNYYPQTKYWSGEDASNMRMDSNVYEWWNWFKGSTPISIDVRIDHDSGEQKSEGKQIVDTQRIYNLKLSKDT